MVKWKELIEKRKGGINNGICWNYMFDNRDCYMPKSFIKIKVNWGGYYDRNNL